MLGQKMLTSVNHSLGTCRPVKVFLWKAGGKAERGAVSAPL